MAIIQRAVLKKPPQLPVSISQALLRSGAEKFRLVFKLPNEPSDPRGVKKNLLSLMGKNLKCLGFSPPPSLPFASLKSAGVKRGR